MTPRATATSPPNDEARAHAARYAGADAHDTWERAVLVAAMDLGPYRSDNAMSGRLFCCVHLVSIVRNRLIARGVWPYPGGPGRDRDLAINPVPPQPVPPPLDPRTDTIPSRPWVPARPQQKPLIDPEDGAFADLVIRSEEEKAYRATIAAQAAELRAEKTLAELDKPTVAEAEDAPPREYHGPATGEDQAERDARVRKLYVAELIKEWKSRKRSVVASPIMPSTNGASP